MSDKYDWARDDKAILDKLTPREPAVPQVDKMEKCLCGHVHPAPTVWGPKEEPQYDYSCGDCPCPEYEDANELSEEASR